MTSKSGVPSPSLLPEGKGKGPTTKSRSNPIEDNIFTHAEKFGLEAGKKPSKGKLSATSSPTLNLPTVSLSVVVTVKSKFSVHKATTKVVLSIKSSAEACVIQ